MKNNLKSLANIGIVTLVLSTGQTAFAFSGGINGYSGNPATNGGTTCIQCHSGGTTPSVNISGPLVVQPGTLNTYTFTISGGQQHSGGLDVSVDAGTLVNRHAATRMQATEITHTQRATAATDGTVTWEFDWRAPSTPGSYTIYAAGLSTNGDGNTTLDAVATSATTVTVSFSAPQPPTAIIHAPLTAALDTSVSFDGSASYDPDGVINQYEWNFADGNTASGAQATHTFTAAGVYTVTLTVTDSDNRSHTTFQDITVGGLMIPVSDPGGPYTGVAGQPVNFNGALSTHVDPIVRYIWDFGDGSPVVSDIISTISHTYSAPGAYTVTLAVQDANFVTGVASTTVVIDAVTPPPELDGAVLYGTNCAGCHAPLDQSTKLNRTATQIQNAIASVSQMTSLSSLTPEQVQAIADALVSITPPPIELDGTVLYGTNCASCHQPLDQSTKLNRTATQIQNAIATVGQMAGLSDLTPEQVQAIADALVSITPPPIELDGTVLYGTYCASCHLPLDQSTKLNRTAPQIQNAISNANPMACLSDLTPEQVQAIAAALVSITPPPIELDGTVLYGTYCASCHLPLDQSTKLNRTAPQIQNAIASESQMAGLSDLTPEQVQAIADALVSITPPPIELDGTVLYGTYCASCHLPLDQSTKLNRTATQIQNAIASVGQMAGLSDLTPEQVQAIADALVSITPPPIELDGTVLYSTYCASCHLPLDQSTKRNRTALQIENAIASVSQMTGLSDLTPEQVQAIADALITGTAPTTGEELYNSYCSVCHGPGGTGGTYESVTGESANSIASAINEVSLMNSISLSTNQIQAIADYLSGAAPTPTPTTGEQLYNAYCLACHGPGGTGGAYESVTGESANSIASAINEVELMNSISLGSSQIEAISDYLNGTGGGGVTPIPTDGATLYSTYCSGCHGSLANSTKLDRTASQIQAAINNVSSMTGLNFLTSTQVQAIAGALATGGGGGTPTPTDGATLYTTYCSSCHGSLANSTKLNRTATQIQAAINNVSTMTSLGFLTSTEVQAIAGALSTGGGGGTPTPTTGEQLYITYCQVCHGFNGTGGSGGAIVGVSPNLINNALASVGQMSGISITSSDVQAIADFLSSGGGTTPEPTTGVDLYNIKCSACHGPGGYGGTEEAVRGASVTEILSAIQSESEMQSIPLTNSQAQAISTYLSNGEEHDD